MCACPHHVETCREHRPCLLHAGPLHPAQHLACGEGAESHRDGPVPASNSLIPLVPLNVAHDAGSKFEQESFMADQLCRNLTGKLVVMIFSLREPINPEQTVLLYVHLNFTGLNTCTPVQ